MAVSDPKLNDVLSLSCPFEQILLDLIDEILEDRMQAEIKEEKLKKRRASRALLAEKRSKIPKTVAEISADEWSVSAEKSACNPHSPSVGTFATVSHMHT